MSVAKITEPSAQVCVAGGGGGGGGLHYRRRRCHLLANATATKPEAEASDRLESIKATSVIGITLFDLDRGVSATKREFQAAADTVAAFMVLAERSSAAAKPRQAARCIKQRTATQLETNPSEQRGLINVQEVASEIGLIFNPDTDDEAAGVEIISCV